MDHSYFCAGLPLLVLLAGGQGGQEGAAHGRAPGSHRGTPRRQEQGLGAAAVPGYG